MSGLDKIKQDQLIADTNNPNPPPATSPSKSVPNPKVALSKSTDAAPSTKPSLKEIKAKLAAQKKAQAPAEQANPEGPILSKPANIAATPAPVSSKATNIAATPASVTSKATKATAQPGPVPSKAANLTAAPMRFRKKPAARPASSLANSADTATATGSNQSNSTNIQTAILPSLSDASKTPLPSQPNVTTSQASILPSLAESSRITSPSQPNFVATQASILQSPTEPLKPSAPSQQNVANGQTAKKTASRPTPSKTSETLNSTPLIEHNIWDSAVNRIRARRLDIHGFRKLQAVLRDESQNNKAEALLEPLCHWLETPPKASDPFESQDIRAQVLITIRQMLTEKFFTQEHYPRILCALLTAKDHHATKGYLVTGLRKTVSYIIWHCNLLECLGAVCTLMEVGHSLDTDEMGLMTLGAMLHRMHEANPKEKANDSSFEKKDEVLVQRLGKIGTASLQSEQLPVRKAAIEFAQEFWHCVPEEDYFKLIASGGTNQQNLLTYYLSRHKQLQDHVEF